jgi:diguanylate cyclase (GGDEF)-like protein/hemerythrin-like metal-binding protein
MMHQVKIILPSGCHFAAGGKMSNGDVSWLSETQIHDLFMQFPLPLAVLDRDGDVKSLNRCFIDNFDVASLKSDSLRKILHDPNDHTRVPVAWQCHGQTSPIFVRVVRIGDTTILVLEKSAEIAYSSELAEMHNRIVELEKLSSTDRLTGAWNRAHFDKTIAVELSRSVRYHQPVALVLLDIDHFKQVNDKHGHAIGDEVLREIVKVVRNNIRTSDMLFRWGGEEFVVLAPSTGYRSAANLAETLRAKIEQHEIKNAGNVTISLGVAEHVSGESEITWFGRADIAMYAAKNSGRNRFVVDQHGSSDLWAADQSAMILRMSWHESYDCGEPTIDQEHRKLFELANALIDATFKRGSHPHEFDEALNKLIAHVAHHFADEEAILAQHRYAGLEVHAQAHKRLIERALQLRDAAAAGGVTVGELVDFLADEVVARHMLKTDRDFYPLFNPSAATMAY